MSTLASLALLLSTDSTRYRRGLRSAINDTMSFARVVEFSLGQGLYNMGRRAAGFVKESVLVAARTQEMAKINEVLGRRVGYTTQQIQAETKAIKERGITTAVAQQTVARFIQFDLDMGKAAELARVAQDSATLSMQDSSQSLEELIHGIVTGESQLDSLRSLGVNVGAAYTEMAQSLGKTSEELTETERRTAILNSILERGKSVAGSYEAAQTTAGKQLRSMRRYVEELKEAIGVGLLEAFGSGVKSTENFIKTLKYAFEEGQPLRELIERISGAFIRAIPVAFAFGALLIQLAEYATRNEWILNALVVLIGMRMVGAVTRMLGLQIGKWLLGAATAADLAEKRITKLHAGVSLFSRVAAAAGLLILMKHFDNLTKKANAAADSIVRGAKSPAEEIQRIQARMATLQKTVDDSVHFTSFGVNFFPFSNDAARAQDEIDALNEKLSALQSQEDVTAQAGDELAGSQSKASDAIEDAEKAAEKAAKAFADAKEAISGSLGASLSAREAQLSFASSLEELTGQKIEATRVEREMEQQILSTIRAAEQEAYALAEAGEIGKSTAAMKGHIRDRLIQMRSALEAAVPPVETLTDRMGRLRERLSGVREDLDNVLGVQIAAKEASMNYEEGLDNLVKMMYELDDQGVPVAHTVNEQQRAFLDVVRAIEAEAFALAESGRIGSDAASVHAFISERLTKLQGQFPALASQIQEYVKHIASIPPRQETALEILPNRPAFAGIINDYLQQLYSIPDKIITEISTKINQPIGPATWAPGQGPLGPKGPQGPEFQHGGIWPQGRSGYGFFEGHEPEAVLPLSKLAGMLSPSGSAGPSVYAGMVVTEKQLADVIRKYNIRTGTRNVNSGL